MNKYITILLFYCCTFLACEKSSDATGSNSSGSVSNGSLTRFITYNNNLYLVDNSSLKVFSISNPSLPVFIKSVGVGFNIETIFVYKDKLLIGSNNSIFIYSVANADNPTLVSQFNYFIPGRDPVVAIDSVAYSTTRNFGTNNGGNLNVINIKDLNNPRQVSGIQLENPYGLAINGNALYVCEGTNGLKVFNRTNAFNPVFNKSITNLNETFYDIIIDGNLMICYIKSGIVLFDVSIVLSPVYISTLKN